MPATHPQGAPIWPTMSTDDPPSNEEIVGHNLAVIADRLDNLTAALERVSSNLSDLNLRGGA